MRYLLPLLFVALTSSRSPQGPPGGQSDNSADSGGGVGVAVPGSLAELKNRRRVLLLVRRSTVVDSRGGADALLQEAYGAAGAPLRYPRIYNLLAQHLNRYMNKYQSISAARSVPDAEFIIFFNLLEYRRPLGHPYPYGELFVILNDTANGHRPRVIWKTRKSLWVEDAVKDLIRDLRTVRGEG
jgi:hypothetical protein